MRLDTSYLAHSIQILEKSLAFLTEQKPDSIDYDVFRNATTKGFELTLGIFCKLIRDTVKMYVATPRSADELAYNDILRNAGRHGLMDAKEVDRWFAYRHNHNSTAHDYGVGFAEETLVLLPGFIEDAKRLESVLREKLGHADA